MYYGFHHIPVCLYSLDWQLDQQWALFVENPLGSLTIPSSTLLPYIYQEHLILSAISMVTFLLSIDSLFSPSALSINFVSPWWIECYRGFSFFLIFFNYLNVYIKITLFFSSSLLHGNMQSSKPQYLKLKINYLILRLQYKLHILLFILCIRYCANTLIKFSTWLQVLLTVFIKTPELLIWLL